MKVDGASLRVNFNDAFGLTAKGGSLKWFQIVGADEKFIDAEATIEGEAVVRSAAVQAVAVRYAWNALAPVAQRFTGK